MWVRIKGKRIKRKYSIQGCRRQDARCKMQDAGYKMQDTRGNSLIDRSVRLIEL